MSSILADNGQQIFLAEDVEMILSMANDRFINEHRSLEYRYTDQEVCEHYDISQGELERMKRTQSL